MTKLKLDLKVEVNVKWEIDENPDLSHLGHYTEDFVEGAINRAELGRIDPNSYKYFVPANHTGGLADWEGVSSREKGRVIRKYGSLANASRAYRLEDYKRMEDFNNEKWHMRGCVVTVSLGSLEAEDSIWGIESDCGEKYEREVARGCTAEALHDLREKIMKRLQVE